MSWKESVSRNLYPISIMVFMFSVLIYNIGYKEAPKNAPPCKVVDQSESKVSLLCPSLFGEVKRVVNLKTGSVSTQTWLEKVD